ncbi:hypothetical protein G6F40_018017 [Rhizopus arrhizus]|nr:hypothetical protein G6F40_018017 [Rhizopus arrhizus]
MIGRVTTQDCPVRSAVGTLAGPRMVVQAPSAAARAIAAVGSSRRVQRLTIPPKRNRPGANARHGAG